MVESKPVISQVQKLKVILHEIHAKEVVLSETFQVDVLIEKMSSTWKQIKNYFNHKQKEN